MSKALAGTALGFTIAAIVLGFIPFLGPLIWIAGVILAIVAIVKCKRPQDGKGMAIASVVLAAVGFFFFLFSVLMTIGFLAYFGAMEPDNFLADRCTLNPPLSCSDFRMTTEGVELSIKNNAGVALEGVTVTSGDDCVGTADLGILENGQSKTMRVCSFSETMRVGQQARAIFDVTYQREDSMLIQSASGSVMGTVS